MFPGPLFVKSKIHQDPFAVFCLAGGAFRFPWTASAVTDTRQRCTDAYQRLKDAAQRS